MKKLKRLGALLLSVALAFSLVACGGKTPPASTPASTGGTSSAASVADTGMYDVTEPITIQWWHALESQYHELVDGIVKDFNESQDMITVEAVYQGSYGDVNEKLLAAQAAGASALPAVTVANTPYVANYGEAGLAEDLGPYIAATGFDIGDFGDGLIASTSYQGAQISLPFLISTQVIYYNKTMADAENIELPENWADMDEFLQKATSSTRKATAVPGWDHWYFETFFLNAGVELIREDETTDLDSEKSLEIANQFQSWEGDGYLDWCFGTDASTNMRQAFFDGKYFSVMHTSSLYNMYVENCDFEVGMAYYPGTDTRFSEVGGSILLIPAKNTQEVKNAGWVFLQYLTSKDINMMWARETGYMPTRKSVLDTQEGKDFLVEKPSFQVVYDNLDNIKPRIQHPGVNEMARIWREAMAKAIQEKGDMGAAMKEAVDAINEALEDA